MKSDQNKEPGINEVLRDHHHNKQYQKHHSLHHHHHHSFTHQHHHHHSHHQDSVSYDVICDEEVSSLLSKIPNFVAKDIEYTGSESIVAEISTVIDQVPPPPPPILVRHLGSRDTLWGGGWPVELKTERPILDFRKMRKRKFQRDGKESKQSLNFLCRLLCRHSLADFNGGNFKPITVIPLKELPFHQTHRHRCRSSIAVAQKCQPSVHLESMVRVGEPLKELATASETEPLRPCAAVKFANRWTFKEGSDLQSEQSGVKSTTSTGDKSDSDADGSILTKFLKTAESKGRATANSFRNTDNNNKNNSFVDNSNTNNGNNNNNNISNNTNNNRLLTFDKIVQEAIASKPTSCQTFHSITNQSWGGVFFPNEATPPFLPIGSN